MFGKSRGEAVVDENGDKAPGQRGWMPACPSRIKSRKAVIALAVTTVLLIIGLAIGLGVGLTRGRGGEEETGTGGNNDNGPPAPPRESLWKPAAGDPWQIVIKRPIKADDALPPDVKILDVDLFDNTVATISSLQASGAKVVCYFSAGSREDWRSDNSRFTDADTGKGLDGWPGEKWINVSSPNVRGIMKDRIKLAARKGCDAIDPDNVDGYQNDNGLDLTPQMAVDFVHFMSQEAAAYNMSTGLKNAGGIIEDVLDSVAFSVNEQCVQYGECEKFAPFVKAGKPVFHIEYPKDAGDGVSSKSTNDICSHQGKAAGSENFSTVIKKMNLDGWVEYCDGKKYATKTA
ncbi:hypothetical protein HIM_00510 [Hirsutella minnesotensis 3608]|nr:hypothetical protein HIM_00510 [Hirsutella minnesotensis 3608]